MKTVLRRSGFAPPQTPLTREENWEVCASGLQLSGGAGQQVLLSVLRGFCQPAVDRVRLPTCGVWRPRDGGCGEIILKPESGVKIAISNLNRLQSVNLAQDAIGQIL